MGPIVLWGRKYTVPRADSLNRQVRQRVGKETGEIMLDSKFVGSYPHGIANRKTSGFVVKRELCCLPFT